MGLADKGKKEEKKTNNNIETNLDKIYSELKKKKSVSLKEISVKFKIPEQKAEEFAKIMDEQGLAKIHYPAVGDVELKLEGIKEDKKQLSKAKKLILFTVFIVVVVSLVVFLIIKFMTQNA